MAAITISIIALFISLYSLWKTHLSSFKLGVTFGRPTIKCYKITSEMSGASDGKIWHIPSIDLPFNFVNLGARPGRILDIKLLCYKLEDRNFKKPKFDFKALWCVNTIEFNKKHSNRFEWISNAVESDWLPFFILNGQPVNKHVILETPGRWDEFPNDDYIAKLLIKSDEQREWKEVQKFRLELKERWVSDEMKNGSSFGLAIIN